MEQWTVREDGINNNGGSVSSDSGRNGEQPKEALEQKREAANRKCEGDAGRHGSRSLFKGRAGYDSKRIS